MDAWMRAGACLLARKNRGRFIRTISERHFVAADPEWRNTMIIGKPTIAIIATLCVAMPASGRSLLKLGWQDDPVAAAQVCLDINTATYSTAACEAFREAYVDGLRACVGGQGVRQLQGDCAGTGQIAEGSSRCDSKAEYLKCAAKAAAQSTSATN